MKFASYAELAAAIDAARIALIEADENGMMWEVDSARHDLNKLLAQVRRFEFRPQR